jgi:hypothetical protein
MSREKMGRAWDVVAGCDMLRGWSNICGRGKGLQACSTHQESELSGGTEMFLRGLHNVAVQFCLKGTLQNVTL